MQINLAQVRRTLVRWVICRNQVPVWASGVKCHLISIGIHLFPRDWRKGQVRIVSYLKY